MLYPGGGGGGQDSNVRAEGDGVKDDNLTTNGEKRSQFFNILAEWTWGQVCVGGDN